MMTSIRLEEIKDEVQEIAKVISKTLKVDVTIVDEKLKRIAGTGSYKDKIGNYINEGSVFNHSIKSAESFIIDRPGKDSLCEMCEERGSCAEYAEVCCPIVLDDKVYGVIGLIAFEEEQAKMIMENSRDYMDFLESMSLLLGEKIKARIAEKKLKLEAKRMEFLLDYVGKALIFIDSQGEIGKLNKKAEMILGTQFNKEELFKSIPELQTFEITKPQKIKERGFFRISKSRLEGIYSIYPIWIDEEFGGAVLVLAEKESMIQEANLLINSSISIDMANILGESSVMRKVKEEAMSMGKSSSTVLIRGESGTGKELFARAIHNASSRKKEAFVAINCGAIPDNLLESELFGYEEGSFTGAKKGGKTGKFEFAHRGTIFLDEIGDMSLHLQVKLLRVLQEKKITPIGSRDEKEIDVRIICATHRNLEEMVKRGEFREDLYYRINVVPLHIPPLKERPEDIEILGRHFLKIYAEKLQKNIFKVDENFFTQLKEYSWPGNVRELENAVEYAVNIVKDGIINKTDLPKRIWNNEIEGFEGDKVKDQEIRTLQSLEENEIRKALEKYDGYKNFKDRAAEKLGISRATLYRKIKEYQIISK